MVLLQSRIAHMMEAQGIDTLCEKRQPLGARSIRLVVLLAVPSKVFLRCGLGCLLWCGFGCTNVFVRFRVLCLVFSR